MYLQNMDAGKELRISMITPNKLVSITYPRHGLHFLKENLTNHIDGIDIYFQHEFIHHGGDTVGNDDLILTVVRNPVDAITSKIIAGLEIHGRGERNPDFDSVKKTIQEKSKQYIDSYVEMYYNLNSYKNLLVVDFEGFIKSPLYVFQYILFNLKVDKSFDKFIMPESNDNFVASSKGNEFYDYCHQTVSRHKDINKAFDAYYMLSKRTYQNIDHN